MKERLWIKLAWLLPRRLAYWAAMRVMVNACGPGFPHSNPDRTSITIAMERW